jgi:hypothetical protein
MTILNISNKEIVVRSLTSKETRIGEEITEQIKTLLSEGSVKGEINITNDNDEASKYVWHILEKTIVKLNFQFKDCKFGMNEFFYIDRSIGKARIRELVEKVKDEPSITYAILKIFKSNNIYCEVCKIDKFDFKLSR